MRKVVPRSTTFEDLLLEYYQKFGYLPTSFTYHGSTKDFTHPTRFGNVEIQFSPNIPKDACWIRLKDDWKFKNGKWICSRPDRNWDIYYEKEDDDDFI